MINAECRMQNGAGKQLDKLEFDELINNLSFDVHRLWRCNKYNKERVVHYEKEYQFGCMEDAR